MLPRTEGMFLYYDVVLQFRDKLLGGTPKNPDVMEPWIKKQSGVDDVAKIADLVAHARAEAPEVAAAT